MDVEFQPIDKEPIMNDTYVWKVRYANKGESKLRCIILETNEPCLTAVAEEIYANDLTADQVVSIRNETLKARRKIKQ